MGGEAFLTVVIIVLSWYFFIELNYKATMAWIKQNFRGNARPHPQICFTIGFMRCCQSQVFRSIPDILYKQASSFFLRKSCMLSTTSARGFAEYSCSSVMWQITATWCRFLLSSQIWILLWWMVWETCCLCVLLFCVRIIILSISLCLRVWLESFLPDINQINNQFADNIW